ncbi:hypothetical protein PV396_16700 [Streptomyces sp. ME02-8801-2C]|uniref:hypothetical protein n=1 Tax=Streptomyces sp. ME02-8801-2C TaxID=3028680 RepID=UPI0029A45EED|nr:hypothetical protein [Streptomyces sp. ME02-8801-2C]MDX3453571.1 hypothetical protein [Streptomyces sp. ME02-8801-2C]
MNLRQVWVCDSLVARMPRVSVEWPLVVAYWAASLTLKASSSSGQDVDQPRAKDLRWSSSDQLGWAFHVVPDEIEPVRQSWNSRVVQDQEWLLRRAASWTEFHRGLPQGRDRAHRLLGVG